MNEVIVSSNSSNEQRPNEQGVEKSIKSSDKNKNRDDEMSEYETK